MKTLRAAIAGILSLAAVTAAFAQSAPANLPYHTVYGRVGAAPGDTGPGQAIPFATLLTSLVGTQTANRIYAGPASGGVAPPTFRALVGADLPNPGASSLGGVLSKTCSSSTWVNALSTGGVLGCTQPSFADLTGQMTLVQLPTIGANTVLCSIAGGTPTACSKTQLTTLINVATASLSGALPAWPNNTTTYFRGDGIYATHNCASLTDSSVGCAAARGQLPGETTTGSATAGNVGEYVEGVLASGSATPMTTNVPKTITSISLAAGDWDVSGVFYLLPAASTSITNMWVTNSTTTNTLDTTVGKFNQLFMAAIVPGTTSLGLVMPTYRISLSSTTTVFLVGQATFTVSTAAGYGLIRARRAR